MKARRRVSREEAMRRALCALSTRDQLALKAFYLEESTASEVAQRMHMSVRDVIVARGRFIWRFRVLYNPPKNNSNARFLVQLLMRGPIGDALLGDLDERFAQIEAEHGGGRARFWYWFQVVISLRPLAWAWLKRGARWTIAYEAIRRAIK